MASLSAAHQSQHGGATTAHRHHHFHSSSDLFGSAIQRLHRNSAASVPGVGSLPAPPPLFPAFAAPAVVGAPSAASNAQPHHLLLNHFLLSSVAPSTSSALNPFARWPVRQPQLHHQSYHSQCPQQLMMEDGVTSALSMRFPSTESFADPSPQQSQTKERAYQNDQQQSSAIISSSSDVSSFSFSCSSSADSDGRSCSSRSCSGGGVSGGTIQPQNAAHQRTSDVGEQQNATTDPCQQTPHQRVQSAAAQQQQQNEPNSAHQQQKSKKLLVRDEAYWERRRKNNDAAKRSRDSRRKKEDEVAIRAVVLEQENLQLRFEVERLRTEIERHRIVAFGETMVAASTENAVEIAVGKMPMCSSAAMAQLTTATATAMGMANSMLNP